MTGYFWTHLFQAGDFVKCFGPALWNGGLASQVGRALARIERNERFAFPFSTLTNRPRSILQQIGDSLFALVFPGPCALCQEPLEEAGALDVCSACWSELQPWSGPACARCGVPFASDRALDAAEPLCADCRQGAFQFDAARTFGLYRGRLRQAILHLKFRPRERWGKRLGGLLAQTWQANQEVFEGDRFLVVPVPLHRGRQRERGYNQAETLARGLIAARGGEKGALRLEAHCLKKTRATPPQTGLSPAERRENVRGAFAVSPSVQITGLAVVLIDDVMTTGATLSACAASLKGAGARRVVSLTLARATPQFPDLLVDETGLK